jgi:hypothetical protein
MAKRKAKAETICNLVVVSDTHCGCRLAICPPDGVALDDGGTYQPSQLQKKLWAYWREFWDEFVPEATRGEPFAVLHNGDAIDGVHHNSTTQISHNLEDQSEIAYQLMKPIVDACDGRYYHIRGTEAHVGKSAQEEERLAKRLGAIPNESGQFARYDLWKMVGPKLIHALHHVGTTGSAAYEATAVHKELTESFVEAARWSQQPPDCIIRSHRHRCIEITIPTSGQNGEISHAIAVVSACWQGKTPFAWKIPGARLSTPQFGGLVIRYAHGELFVRKYVRTVERSKVE